MPFSGAKQHMVPPGDIMRFFALRLGLEPAEPPIHLVHPSNTSFLSCHNVLTASWAVPTLVLSAITTFQQLPRLLVTSLQQGVATLVSSAVTTFRQLPRLLLQQGVVTPLRQRNKAAATRER